MFPTVEAAAAFCQAVDNRTLPGPVSAALSNFLDHETTNLVTFCAYIPPEALQGCNEKEIVTWFKAGMSDTAVIKPAAPDASV
jgi:hypothetical protein